MAGTRQEAAGTRQEAAGTRQEAARDSQHMTPAHHPLLATASGASGNRARGTHAPQVHDTSQRSSTRRSPGTVCLASLTLAHEPQASSALQPLPVTHCTITETPHGPIPS